MDEKTEELRDIFMDVTDEATVTEEQADDRGSLAGTDEGDADERLADVIERMRERGDFRTDLTTEELATVVKGFYDSDADAQLAEETDVSRGTIFRARMDLHLVRESDTEAPFDLAKFRKAAGNGASIGDLAERFDVAESTARRYRHVVDAQRSSRQVSHRFQSEFEEILTDTDLSANLTESVQEDGLKEATEDIETDVSF
jgi:hypothetical protein